VGWPPALERMFTTKVGVIHLGFGLLGENGRRVLEAWSRSPNVLLYGPPGTGKTHLLNEMRGILSGGAVSTVMLNTTDADNPFLPGTDSVPIPLPVRSAFVTFHQNYGYEDFIVGLRPQPGASGGVSLVPRLGVLLDLVLSLSSEVDAAVAQPGSAVLFVDEINRGNVSRIFGEFITFMELGYRATLANGSINPHRLPVPLLGIDLVGALTVPVDRPSGGQVRLQVPWHFPRHVYTLATMNSVDRAVAPLDTALARRFARVALRPDMELLAQWLEIADTDELLRRFAPQHAPSEEDDDDGQEFSTPSGAQELTPWETGWLLLQRINDELAGSFGPDFELGHVYMIDLKDVRNDADAWLALARIWDDRLFPQLVDRFAMRPDELTRLLKLRATPPAGYLYRERQFIGRRPSTAGRGAGIVDVALTALLATNKEHVVATLQFLAKP
jgi:DNA polymerase III delta prime subunit